MSAQPLLACLRWILLLLLLAAQARSALSADVWQSVTAGVKPSVDPRFFGLHVHRLEGVETGRGVRPSPFRAADTAGLRLWDAGVTWFDINRQAGEFDFSRMDGYVALAHQRGTRLIYPLGMTPAWASQRPSEPCPYGLGCAAEPRTLEAWEAYVRAVLSRYRDQLWMIEVWNEPYFSDFKEDRGHQSAFFSGSADTLVEMTRVVRQAIDELSPTTRLCSPSFVGSAKRLDLFLEKGGGQYIDAVCSHLYARSTRELARNVLELRAVLVRRGISKLPLLNTESGVAADEPSAGMQPPGETASREAAARMAQQMIVAAMAGLDAFYYYAWDNEHTGLFEPDGNPRPGLFAWFAVRRWLVDVQPRGCRESAAYPGVVICRAERAGQRHAWVWHDGPGRKKVQLRVLWRELGLASGVQTIQPLFREDMADFTTWVSAGEIQLGASPVALTFRN